MNDRSSEAEVPVLIEDPVELAKKEAQNSLIQFDWAMEQVERWISDGKTQIRVSTLLNLHRKAMNGIDQFAGNFRPAGVAIRGSGHDPIAADDVPRYVEEMCEYITNNWNEKTAIHLAAYAMWRLNWIHPFADGNGRTSRILSYMVLCGKLNQILPGSRTIPEQISENKKPYYDALEAADAKYKNGGTDVSEMELLLEGYLANQLIEIHEKATGNDGDAAVSPNPKVDSKFQKTLTLVESHPVISGGIILLFVTACTIIFS